jgi:FecR protein
MTRLGTLIFSIGMLGVFASAAAAGEVGTVAGAEGSAEVQHDGRWSPARIGDPVQVGDAVRTGPDGRARLVFQDDTVLNVGNSSFLVVDRQVFDPEKEGSRSLLKLLRGRVRALVSDYYSTPGSSYEIETDTAVAGVRGTEFIVNYDPEQFLTEVIGVSGTVQVNSVLDRARRGVYVTAGELSTVRRGQFPGPPPRLDEDTFRQYLEGLQFVGFGRPESLTALNTAVSGIAVSEPERAPAASALSVAPSVEPPERDASTLVGQPPGVLLGLTGALVVRF